MTEHSFDQPLPDADLARRGMVTDADAPLRGAARTALPAWAVAAALVAVTLALYWPARHFDFIVYDDPDYASLNTRVQAGLTLWNVGWAFTTAQASNWHPLTWLSLMLDVNLFGVKAAGFHFTNLVIHAVNAAMLFWLLRCLTNSVGRSAFVACFFAWHPVHVESVAWISERKDVLSACFGFLTLLCYAGYAQKSERRSQKPEAREGFWRSPKYWLAFIFFALGLMSKPMLVTWPFVLLLLDFWPLGRWKPGCRGLLMAEKIPFLILAVGASIITFVVQKRGGTVVAMEHLTLAMRAGNAVVSFSRYLGKLFWPVNLSIFYPHPGYWPAAAVVMACALVIGVSLFVYWQRQRQPALLTGWLWFVGTLLPVIGLVQVGEQSMADRYAYIPSVGVFVMVVWGAHDLICRWRLLTIPCLLAGSVALLLSLYLTRQQLAYWRSSESLFEHALAVTKNNFVAHNCLGIAFANHGRNDAAIIEFQQAIRLKPGYGYAYGNLGLALAKQGRADDAIACYQMALRINPEESFMHDSLGKLLVTKGRTDEAITQFQEAVRLKPEYAEAHNNLGMALASRGRVDEAAIQYREAIQLEPDDAIAHDNLGNSLAGQGQTNAAISEYEEAIRLKPDYAKAYNNLGIVRFREGLIDAAVTNFQEALRLNPHYAKAHDNLGQALAALGRTDQAIGHYQAALRLQPENAEARSHLAKAMAGDTNQPATFPIPAKP